MYPRYYPQRAPQHGARSQRDVVPRELAARIAQERDILHEELRRTQQAYQRGQEERQQLAQQLRRATQLSRGSSAHDEQLLEVQELTLALEEMTRQRDEAERASLSAPVQELAVSEQEVLHQETRALITSMLELRDSIERASAMTTDPKNPWKQGLDHMVRQFDEILTTHGWVALGEIGEQFNPEVHEAVGVHDAAGAVQTEVYEVSRQGFAHEASGDVIRPAQVIVSK